MASLCRPSLEADQAAVDSRYHFFDSDTLVERGTGSTVAQIFEEEGEEGFREAETSVMQVQSRAHTPGLDGVDSRFRRVDWFHASRNRSSNPVTWVQNETWL